MNKLKIYAMMFLLMIILNIDTFVYASAVKSHRTTIDPETGLTETKEWNLWGEKDNSALIVEVWRSEKISDDSFLYEIIYIGPLGEYENGVWKNVNFDMIDFLQILDSKYGNHLYIIPAAEYSDFEVNIDSDKKSYSEENQYNLMPESDEFSISSKIMLNNVEVNENGMRIIDNADVQCRLSVTNKSNLKSEVVVIFSTYSSNGKLYNINSFKSDIESGESQNIEFTYNFDAENEQSGKIMIWNSMSTMKPLRASVNFSQTSGVNAYYYNADNRLLQIDKMNGTSLVYTYDNMGNLLTKTVME